MTVTEFSNEFDIYYNSIASNSAPGLDLYEKSTYLTKAQLELVKNYFNPKGNKYQEGFENSSKRRTDLNELVKSNESITTITSTKGVSVNSKFYKLPSDLFLIIQEQAVISSSDVCLNNTTVNVIPKTHDEYNTQKNNPFKSPDKSIIWRLDFYSQDGINKNVELISPYSITKYQVRYISYPEPIILTDLTAGFAGEGLSIDGKTTSQSCKLSESIHREILDRAVELALSDYKQNNLALKQQLNSRNE
jgi:hypothetical protein